VCRETKGWMDEIVGVSVLVAAVPFVTDDGDEREGRKQEGKKEVGFLVLVTGTQKKGFKVRCG